MPSTQRSVPSRERPTAVRTGLLLARELLLDPRRFWQLAALLVAGELALGLLIIRFVSCTYL